jgi:hypothetical protein
VHFRECERQDRIGGLFGDGGKFVCGMDVIAKQDACLVYSVGSNLDTKFEESVRQHAQNCEIHTFDPTIDVAQLDTVSKKFNFSVHPWGLGSSERSFQKGAVMPLGTIMQKLGHVGRPLTLLKIDCEGCEYEVADTMFAQCRDGAVQIDQVLIELHGTNASQVVKFFQGADACGLMIFHKERNHWGCDGYKCVEFGLISKHAAKRAFDHSHGCIM